MTGPSQQLPASGLIIAWASWNGLHRRSNCIAHSLDNTLQGRFTKCQHAPAERCSHHRITHTMHHNSVFDGMHEASRNCGCAVGGCRERIHVPSAESRWTKMRHHRASLQISNSRGSAPCSTKTCSLLRQHSASQISSSESFYTLSLCL